MLTFTHRHKQCRVFLRNGLWAGTFRHAPGSAVYNDQLQDAATHAEAIANLKRYIDIVLDGEIHRIALEIVGCPKKEAWKAIWEIRREQLNRLPLELHLWWGKL